MTLEEMNRMELFEIGTRAPNFYHPCGCLRDAPINWDRKPLSPPTAGCVWFYAVDGKPKTGWVHSHREAS